LEETLAELLRVLNPDQRAAVTAPEGPVLVVAGAGSGKTRVLTTRIAWLLARGTHPGAVLAFTFTNKAAKEMRGRVDVQVGAGRAPFWIGTFHATCLKLLRADGAALGLNPRFAIYDTDDQKRLLKQVLAAEKIDPKQFPVNVVRTVISRWKNDDVAPEAAATAAVSHVDEIHATLYAAYERALTRCGALDFDDLILRAVHLLERHDEVRARYAGRFQHVLVDEFQDTNSLQLLLVKLLSSEHGNLFAVGDDDQSIYGWRGARVENMLEFEQYFPGTHLFRLEQNYRSTGNILAAANAVIAHNRRRKGKNLWTEAGAGDPLTVEEHLDGEDEAARIVEIVRAECAAGLTRGDVTVLYRTNAQSRLVEDALRRARVAHQVVGSVQFYERKEVRDILAYLKLIANPADEISLQRIINVPKRRLGETTVERFLAAAAQANLSPGEFSARDDLLEPAVGLAAAGRLSSFFDQVARWRTEAATGALTVPALLAQIVKGIDYAGWLHQDDPETAETRLENVAELVNATHAFHEGADDGTLAQFLEQIALVADADTIREGEGAVRLMTIHTAKGLEFPIVILAGCEDALLPHLTSSETDAGVEEERRLFYVALTRARRRAYLLHAARRRRFGAHEDCLPSRFLGEIPDLVCTRRELNRGWQPPVGQTLFGTASAPRQAPTWVAPSNHPARLLGPRPKPSRPVRQTSEWHDDVVQAAPFFPGQHVSHSSFGAGVVLRVEGLGDDLVVTVDFRDAGHKHIIPRFAPLVGLD